LYAPTKALFGLRTRLHTHTHLHILPHCHLHTAVTTPSPRPHTCTAQHDLDSSTTGPHIRPHSDIMAWLSSGRTNVEVRNPQQLWKLLQQLEWNLLASPLRC
jgi:hypothetical protein